MVPVSEKLPEPPNQMPTSSQTKIQSHFVELGQQVKKTEVYEYIHIISHLLLQDSSAAFWKQPLMLFYLAGPFLNRHVILIC